MTRFLIISIFIFVNQLSANNKDEKIFKNIISNYNLEKSLEDFWFTEEQSKILCGEYPLSTICELKAVYVTNEIRKKRIMYLLNQISQKYNIDKKLVYKLNSKYLKYIYKNQKVDHILMHCSICHERSIREDLSVFENNLESILENRIKILPFYDDTETDKNLNYKPLIKSTYEENLILIEELKNNDEIEYKKLKKDFIDIHKLWNDYETTLTLFLNKTKKNDYEWEKLFYKDRIHYLHRQKDSFEDIKNFPILD